MRKVVVLAAVVAALGMASHTAEARDRGFGFRHFSGHAGPKLHLRHHGLKFHHGGVFGKHRPFKSRHFRHFGQRGFASKFGHVPRLKPTHFGHFGQGGLVLKFGERRLRAQVRSCAIQQAPSSRSVLRVRSARRFRPWHDRGSAFEDRHGVHGHRQSMPGSQGGQGGGPHGGAPPEALLQQLEAMGFRHVPELLCSRDP
jgi:hypothetical protein